jgi:single-strand DNA-binding protein
MRYTLLASCNHFSVATSRNWNTADGERHTETEWFNIVAWGNLLNSANNTSQRSTVYIEGRLQSRTLGR